MIDYRTLQRTLFRMQLDPVFAAAVMTGDAAPTGLGDAEMELLRKAAITGILADPGGRRRAQILGNVGSEFALTLAEAAREGRGVDVLHAFPASEAFHEAIQAERPLPLAFGAWLRETLDGSTHGVAGALAVLENAMASARRLLRPAASPGAGETALGARTWLVELPDGAFDHAQRARAALDAGEAVPAPGEPLVSRASNWLAEPRADSCAPKPERDPRIVEVVLLVASIQREGHRLRDVAA
jgi:hypothetical protein